MPVEGSAPCAHPGLRRITFRPGDVFAFRDVCTACGLAECEWGEP